MELLQQAPEQIKEIFTHEKKGLFHNEQNEYFFQNKRKWYKMSPEDMGKFIQQMSAHPAQAPVITEQNHHDATTQEAAPATAIIKE